MTGLAAGLRAMPDYPPLFTPQHHNIMDINTLKVAEAISPTDTGFVTADMLYEFMAANSNTITGGTVTWDVDKIDIRCKGKNILSTDAIGDLMIGNLQDSTYIRGNSLRTNSNSRVVIHSGDFIELKSRWTTVEGTSTLNLYGPTMDVYGSSKVTVRSLGTCKVTGKHVDVEGAGGNIGMTALAIKGYAPNVNLKSGTQMNITSEQYMDFFAGRPATNTAGYLRLESTGNIGMTSVGIHTYSPSMSLHAEDMSLVSKRIDMQATEISQHK